jgi:predicted dehydrogenase
MAGNYRLDPTRGGGALYDVGCYSISAAHLALGPDLAVERAEAVFGPTGVDLAATVTLRAGHGTGGRSPTDGPVDGAAKAVARCGIALPERQALSVTGETARVDFTVGEAFTTWHQPCELAITTPGSQPRIERFAPVDAYRLMIESMVAAVQGRPGFMIEPEFSLAVAGTLDAARAALAAPPDRPRAP